MFNLKIVKNTHRGVLLLVNLQALAATLLKVTFLHGCFFTFFKLYKLYQIVQLITYPHAKVVNIVRSGSRTAATSKMERFVIIVNGWKPLTITTERSILDVAAALDPPLISNEENIRFLIQIVLQS